MPNEEYTIEFSAPLLRPGITISTGPLSIRYIQPVINEVLEIIRNINSENKGEES